jgi:hypothetical protein
VKASSPLAFTYPAAVENRRHGPSGYSDYKSFRPWLRDEFSFRCVFCLIRERWGRVTGEFDLDHFVPQARDASLSTDYLNLLYACHCCNAKKGSAALPEVERVLTLESVRVALDGRIVGMTPEAERIIDVMTLNSSRWVQWRLSWIRIIELAAENDPILYRQLMGFPDDLPNLSVLKPPHNSRPEGIEQSHFARRERGELPDSYIS